MKTTHQKKIEKFMSLAGQETPVVPTEPDSDTKILRAKLIIEESLETIKALGVDITMPLLNGASASIIDCEKLLEYSVGRFPFDMVEVADGCADVSVVTTGCLSSCGISDKKLLSEVDNNNLKKFGPGHKVREDGKLIKPPGHKAPNIRKILIDQGWEG